MWMRYCYCPFLCWYGTWQSQRAGAHSWAKNKNRINSLDSSPLSYCVWLSLGFAKKEKKKKQKYREAVHYCRTCIYGMVYSKWFHRPLMSTLFFVHAKKLNLDKAENQFNNKIYDTKYWLRHLVAFHKWCSYVWYSRFVFTDVTGSVYGNNKYVIIGRIHFDTHISFAVVSLQRFFFSFLLFVIGCERCGISMSLHCMFFPLSSECRRAAVHKRNAQEDNVCMKEKPDPFTSIVIAFSGASTTSVCLPVFIYFLPFVRITASHRIWFRFGCTVVSYSLV